MATAELGQKELQKTRMSQVMGEIRNLGDRLGEDTEDGFRAFVDMLMCRKGFADMSPTDREMFAAERYVVILRMTGVTD